MTSIPRNTNWGTAAEAIEQLVDTAIGAAVMEANSYTDEQVGALSELEDYLFIKEYQASNYAWPLLFSFPKGTIDRDGATLTSTVTVGEGDASLTFRFQSSNIPVPSGATTLYLKAKFTSGTGCLSNMQPVVNWWNSEAGLISQSTGASYAPGQTMQMTLTPPAGAVNLTVWFRGASGGPTGTLGDTATVENVIVSDADVTYFDGDSSIVTEWSGTPWQSKSVLYRTEGVREEVQALISQVNDLQEQVDNIDTGGIDADDPEILDRGLAHSLLVQQLLRRHGGPIGVGNVPVVSLRFDDYLASFQTKVLPVLQEHKLPASLAVNVSKFGGSEFGSVTANDVQGWAYAHGIEVWNHGKTHLDAEGKEAIYEEIVGGLTELRAAMPNLFIDGWIMPGTADPTNQYDGLGTGYTLAHWSTYAGQLIRTHHAIATGTLSGQEIYPLMGFPQDSMPYINMDTSTAETVQARLERLTPGTGTCLMIHPGRINTGGYMSQAEFETLMAWLADERDAGNLVVLTMSGMAVAHAGTDYRHELIPLAGQSLTAGVPWSRSVSMLDKAWMRGTVWEAVATVTTTGAATVTLSATDDPGYVAASHEHEFAGAGTHTLRCHFTLPRSQTHPLTLTVFTEDSGVTVADCGAWSV